MITHIFDFPRPDNTIRIVYSKPVTETRKQFNTETKQMEDVEVTEVKPVFHERVSYVTDYESELASHVEEMKGKL